VTIHKSLALTLRCGDYSETSQVVSLLARSVGAVKCLAKGSKRGRNPFGGPLDRWTLGEAVFSLRDPNRLATLMELYELERFEGLRTGLPAFFGACAATELVLALVPEVDPQPEVFDLVIETLRRLARAEAEAARAIAFAFAWRLLALLGYGPDLEHCVQCGRPLAEAGPGAWSGALGGLVCSRCDAPDRRIPFTGKSAQALAFLLSAGWAEVERVRLSSATAEALRGALGSRVAELAGRQLSALKYV